MSIPVDPSYRLIASGNVEAVREWTETEQGRRRSDVQASNDQGIPLWQVEVLRSVQVFGETKTAAVPVQVAAKTEPVPEAFAPVGFDHLTVEFFVRKGGALGERWEAEGLVDPLTEVLEEDGE